jgi:hypothetical protein
MHSPGCPECKNLLQQAIEATRLHLESARLLAWAASSEKGADIGAATRALRLYRLDEMTAIQRYESHAANHDEKVMTAGSGEYTG